MSERYDSEKEWIVLFRLEDRILVVAHEDGYEYEAGASMFDVKEEMYCYKLIKRERVVEGWKTLMTEWDSSLRPATRTLPPQTIDELLWEWIKNEKMRGIVREINRPNMSVEEFKASLDEYAKNNMESHARGDKGKGTIEEQHDVLQK